ncbi:MAG: hypothetical protein CVU39_07960 [Chloroflexi bacterium HGW-Chloroflexi-10]|nr:MAG: hypothetical protein CVU39_07960 [Chloroflexi bacterium HGW-Chloroflexi-10]
MAVGLGVKVCVTVGVLVGSGVGVTVGAGVGINPQADNRMERVQNRLSKTVYFFMFDDFLPWFGIGYRCNYTGG